MAGMWLLGRDADVTTIGCRLLAVIRTIPGPPLGNWLNREGSVPSSFQAADTDLEVAAMAMLKLLDQCPPLHVMSIADAASLVSCAGQTVLHLSASLGFEGLSEELISRGIDPNNRDTNGYTALHFAALFGHTNCARVLLHGGADGDIVNAVGHTAGTIARDSKHHSLAELLEPRAAMATEVNDVKMEDCEHDVKMEDCEHDTFYRELAPEFGPSPFASSPKPRQDRKILS